MAGKTATTPTPVGFKFEEETAGGQPKKVIAVTPTELVLVTYTDAEGKEQNRLCAVVTGQKGGKKAFIFQERIQGQFVSTSAHEWFNEELVAFLQKNGKDGGVKSV